MEKLLKFAGFLDRITERMGSGVSWLSTALVLVVCFDVLTRYLFNTTSSGLVELEWHIFAVLFLLSAGYTLKQDRHVRVDVFYSLMKPKTKAWINLSGLVFALIPFSLLVIYSSLPFIYHSYSLSEISSDPGGLPFRWLIKSMIPLGFSVLIIQAVSEAIHQLASILTINEKESQNGH